MSKSVIYYQDDDGNAADESVATRAEIVEFDDAGNEIRRTYGTLTKQPTEELTADERKAVDEIDAETEALLAGIEKDLGRPLEEDEAQAIVDDYLSGLDDEEETTGA